MAIFYRLQLYTTQQETKEDEHSSHSPLTPKSITTSHDLTSRDSVNTTTVGGCVFIVRQHTCFTGVLLLLSSGVYLYLHQLYLSRTSNTMYHTHHKSSTMLINSFRPYMLSGLSPVRLSVRHTCGSVKNC